MAQNVVITLDLGKGVDLGRLQLSFHGAPLASLDYMSDSKAGIVSMIKLDKCCTTIHLFVLPVRQILRSKNFPSHDDVVEDQNSLFQRKPIQISQISVFEFRDLLGEPRESPFGEDILH